MRIYLDPHYKNGCTVWFDNGNVQTLKGSIEDIGRRLEDFIMQDEYDYFGNKIGRCQVMDVYLDTMGV